jgi:hypothetical protein
MGGRWWLSTAASASPEGRSGWRRRSGLGVCTARGKGMQMGLVLSLGSVGQKREGEEVGTSAERGSDDVVAGGRLGRSWRAQNKTVGEG